MRNIFSVLDAILKQIPDSFTHKKNMVRRFGFVQDSIRYTAPEALYLRWEQCAEILGDYIPSPEADWQITVAKIFNAELDYKDYL